MSDFTPTPGSVRIVSTSPFPMDAKAEVMQADGTWLPLRICSISTHLDANQMNTATIVVEPSSIDMFARLESYGAARVEAPPRQLSGDEEMHALIKALRRAATETFGPNVKLSDALDSLT